MNKTQITKIIWLMIGSALMGLAVAVTIQAGLGVDPLSAFIDGISKQLGITVGWSARLVMAVIVVALFFIDRSRIGVGTIINGFMVGTFADYFMGMDFPIHNVGLISEISWFLIGATMLGIGIGLYISASYGEAGIDAIMILLSERTGRPVDRVRIVLDIIIGITAWFMGGQIFIGTIISMAINGPVIKWTVSMFNKHLYWTINQSQLTELIEEV